MISPLSANPDDCNFCFTVKIIVDSQLYALLLFRRFQKLNQLKAHVTPALGRGAHYMKAIVPKRSPTGVPMTVATASEKASLSFWLFVLKAIPGDVSIIGVLNPV